MYRYSQTLPGGPITLVGIIVLSFLVPGWVANALGFGAANAQLVDWILSHRVISCIALLLLYGLGGFALLVGAGMAVYAAYFVLTRDPCYGQKLGGADKRRHRAVAGRPAVLCAGDRRRKAVRSNSERHGEGDRISARTAPAAGTLSPGLH